MSGPEANGAPGSTNTDSDRS
nr:mesohalic catalase {internal fragment} [Halobacterium halobium, NRL, Peptide Partial, 20 aa] [Halobacterium salinarum]